MLGKISGAAVGFGLGVLWGNAGLALILATAGLVIGHLLIDRVETPARPLPQKPRAERPPVPPVPSRATEDLARALCPVFIEVARSDGEVTQPEIRAVKDFFSADLRFAADGLEAVRVALKDAIAAGPQDLEALVKAARAHVAPPERLKAVNALYEMALADGDLTRAENDALKRVVTHFNLSEEQLREITQFQLGSGAQAYAALGLDPEASDDDVKGAFRRLAAEHHPDRFASQGPRAAEAAAEKFRKIKDAYDDLKKLRGL